MKYLTTTLFLLVLFSSCKDEDSCTSVDYEVAFLLEAGQNYCFPDDTQLEVKTLNNEYCPCDVQCIWGGQMTVDMVWTHPDGTETVYKHNSAADIISNEQIPDGIVVTTDLELTHLSGYLD